MHGGWSGLLAGGLSTGESGIPRLRGLDGRNGLCGSNPHERADDYCVHESIGGSVSDATPVSPRQPEALLNLIIGQCYEVLKAVPVEQLVHCVAKGMTGDPVRIGNQYCEFVALALKASKELLACTAGEGSGSLLGVAQAEDLSYVERRLGLGK